MNYYYCIAFWGKDVYMYIKLVPKAKVLIIFRNQGVIP